MPATSKMSRNGGDGLLNEPAHLLNHRKPVRGLHAGTLQAVVEDRVFVYRHIERRGLPHDLHADVVGVAVGKQIVKIIHCARENACQDRECHLRAYQPPEMLG
jgi:hypothetical protein